jgi:Leucine-rich repeat (LRR) protein
MLEMRHDWILHAQGDSMPKLNYEKPPESLADELREVEQNAQKLKDALNASNLVPNDFPKDEVIELLEQLYGMAEGTAEGCRQPLETARSHLTETKGKYIFTPARSLDIPKNAEKPPPLMRGEEIDQCFALLLGSVSTALNEYRRLASVIDDLNKTDTSPSQEIDRLEPAVTAAIAKSLETETNVGKAIQDVEELTKPESKPADNLKRQMRDSKRLLGLSRVELKLPAFVPRWYRATIATLADYPALIRKTAKTVIVGVDVARPLVDGWSKFNHGLKHSVLDGIEEAAKGYLKLADKWEAERNQTSDVGNSTNPPADFDIREVKVMILRGEEPPKRWWPWITTLDLRGTNITNLEPVKALTALQSLDLRGLKVTDLEPIKALSDLQSLSLSKTRITDFEPIKALTAMQSLRLSGKRITDLEWIRALTSLQSLHIRGVQISDLEPLRVLTSLQLLDLWGTRVTDLEPIKALGALQSLDISRTMITDLEPIRTLTALQSLNLSKTMITDLEPIKALFALQSLRLAKTTITDLEPIKALSALQSLDLSETKITSLTPIKALTGLQSLNIRYTNITDLTPLTGHLALEDIYVEPRRVGSLEATLGRKGVVKYQKWTDLQ